MFNLSYHADRKKLVDQIQKDINDFCIAKFAEEPRTHLGASIVGHDCKRYSWSVFRWLKQEKFTGQMYRLFNRGHLEENRFVRWLVGIGFEVKELDEATKKQFRITGCKGHFGGSLDAMMKAPTRYNIAEDLIFLGEFKTHNEKSFAKLAGPKRSDDLPRTGGKGVQVSKPMHYRQCCSYGRAYGLRYGLYCAVNKDTDELYFEIIEIDDRQADDLYRKAEEIIFTKSPPEKIAQTATFFDCSYCNFSSICHNNEIPEVNCRSCIHSTPIDNAEWFCLFYTLKLEKQTIATGCKDWVRIV